MPRDYLVVLDAMLDHPAGVLTPQIESAVRARGLAMPARRVRRLLAAMRDRGLTNGGRVVYETVTTPKGPKGRRLGRQWQLTPEGQRMAWEGAP